MAQLNNNDMAHFAELDDSNKVLRVVVVGNDQLTDGTGGESELTGIQFCHKLFGGVWKQTSYNTSGGVHKEGGIPFRKNYAGTGYDYDEDRDAFISPQPYDSWTLNEDTCMWDAPVPYPDDGKLYKWDEDIVNWVEISPET
jgi:hypothetical protein